MEDLDKLFVLPDVRTKKIEMLVESGKKIFREAEHKYREGDEELAYVYYMKYFKLLHCIYKKPDYARHKQAVREMLGGNKVNNMTMDKVELLNKSLTRRYNLLHAAKSTEQRFAGETKLDTASMKALAELPPPPETPEISFLTHNFNVINCKQLFELIQENSVLIMDCRPSADYQISHLTYQWALNVPEEFISAGMSAGKLQGKLDNQTKVLWSARSVKDHVVLIGWNTNNSTDAVQTPCSILLDILRNWDPDVTYRSPLKILEGGYEYFIMMYPTHCTNPIVQAPQRKDNDFDLIDDIEYPSIHDITMKDEIRERGYTLSPLNKVVSSTPALPDRPRIDRSSKVAAIKKYEQSSIVEIVKEQEELLQKAQVNDEQLKQTTKKLETLYEEKSNEINDARRSEEQELLFDMMQLDSAAEDDKIKTNYLLAELDVYKKRFLEQQQQISPSEAVYLEDVLKKIADKLHERQLLNQKREDERLQRELQLAAARELKRQMKPPVVKIEKPITPPLPQIDRTIKPVLGPALQFKERSRDFSPVPGNMGRGLTGLKNLGNTCYMNSILQCLSNTPQLPEYCLTDKYKSYINRSSNTKGHIIEEFAALIKVLWNGRFKFISSKYLCQVIGEYHTMFRGCEQQDSHEFLTILMDWLHSDLQTLSVQEKPKNIMSASERAWLEFTKARESLILHLFYGQIKSTVKCTACNKESATYESFSNLSLELPSNASVCPLEKCMDMYFSGEPINGWNCPNCKQKRNAIKKLDISKLPPVLVIHLKRFYADTDGVNLYKKKQNYVQFALENLDMTPYIARSESRSLTPKTYQLYGVSNHYGTMEGGHYTAFCKSGTYDSWFKFDDQVVTSLDTSRVVSSAAYILFYTWLPPMQYANGD